jgi:hypothetical protein
MNIVVVWIMGCCIIALAIAVYLKNKADNRRINRFNRNIDRHNQMMEMLLKDKQEGNSNTDHTEKTE